MGFAVRYLLDTNICIHAIKGNTTVLQHMQEAGRESLCVSAVVVAELAFGVARSAEAYRAKNRSALESYLSGIDVLPWPNRAGWLYGVERQRLKAAGTPVGELDLLMGVHALAEDFTMVTNNTREFQRINGLRLQDWTGA